MATSPVSAMQSDQFAGLANGMRLHFASAGIRGRPLVLFMHGFPEAWFAWEAQLEFLGAEYYAVAVDLRGFNRSRKPADVEAYRAGTIVEDMKLLIAQLGYREATVVAHDWGGAIAWNLAIAMPKLIRKLVIINAPHPFLFARQLHENPAQQQASGYMNRLRRPGSEVLLAENDFQRLDAVFAPRPGSAPDWYDAPLRARYHAMWSIPGDDASHPLTGAVNYYRASPLHPATPEEPVSVFGAMRAPDWTVLVPVRVIWGLDDTALLPSLLDGLEEFCADLSITRVSGATHWVVHERPAEVNTLIAQALDR